VLKGDRCLRDVIGMGEKFFGYQPYPKQDASMKKKILIIDDETDLLALLEHIFLSTGLYDVVTASNGLQGKQKAVKEKPDIIFLDYIMPEVMGDDVLKFVRSQPELNRVAVVIMSGLGGAVFFNQEKGQEFSPDDLDAVPKNLLEESSSLAFPKDMIQKYGVVAVLPKPFSREKLLQMTERIFSDQSKMDSR